MKTELKPGDFYWKEDDKGREFRVFTEQYHLKRGFCCGNTCRHCPWKHVNVPKKKEDGK